MPCLSIASFGTSPDLLSVIYLTLATYWKQNLNVFCPMPPNVIHTQYQNCAYILHILCIQLICLCMVESAIRVCAFFQDVVHAHISFSLKVSLIFWQISHCLFSHNQYFSKHCVAYFCRNLVINLMITGWRCYGFGACHPSPCDFWYIIKFPVGGE